MKIVWVLLIIILFLGCTSNKIEEPVQEEISFEQGIEKFKADNLTYIELDEYEPTKDVEALKKIIEIETVWTDAKINLESGSKEGSSCVILIHLDNFKGNATITVNQMQEFIETYPEFLDNVEFSNVTIEDINNNIGIIEEIKTSEEFIGC